MSEPVWRPDGSNENVGAQDMRRQDPVKLMFIVFTVILGILCVVLGFKMSDDQKEATYKIAVLTAQNDSMSSNLKEYSDAYLCARRAGTDPSGVHELPVLVGESGTCYYGDAITGYMKNPATQLSAARAIQQLMAAMDVQSSGAKQDFAVAYATTYSAKAAHEAAWAVYAAQGGNRETFKSKTDDTKTSVTGTLPLPASWKFPCDAKANEFPGVDGAGKIICVK